jgi:hypothetical protein
MGEMYCQRASQFFKEHEVLRSVNTIKNKAGILQQVGAFLHQAGIYPHVKSVTDQFLMTSLSIQYQEDIAAAFNMLGNISHDMGKFDEAREMFGKVLFTQLKLFRGIILIQHHCSTT